MTGNDLFRAELEQILAEYGHVLSIQEVAECTGRSRSWVYRHLPVNGGSISAVRLARELANWGK